jgi:DNA adenine methylase
MRYFGGKWRLAPWILGHFPPHRIYVEAFGGGASVLLQKSRAYGEIYNDLDGEVVNVFRVLQRHSRRFHRLIVETPFARDEMELAYRPCKDPVERARRTIIRSFMGFGADSVTRDCRTGFRSNSNRSGTTPAHDWATWSGQIEAFRDRLRGVVIENRNAIEVMESQDSEKTLHYVDPPYPLSTRGLSSHGYRHEMTNQDHSSLVERLGSLKGMVVVSGYPHPIYDGMKWDRVQTLERTLGSGGSSADRTEALWLNPAAAAAQKQGRLF